MINKVAEEQTPAGSFKRLMQKYNQQSAKWSGLIGSENMSSVNERENLLAESNCLLFSGTDRFLSYFDSRRLASSNLNGSFLLIIFFCL